MNFMTCDSQPKVKFQVFAVPEFIEGMQYNANGKPFQKCSLRDDMGVVKKLKVYQGNNPLLGPQQLNQRAEFSIQADDYQGKRYYMGFWQCPNLQENQVPPQGYQQPPQAPPQQQNYQPPAQTPPPQQNRPQGEPQRNMTYAYESAPHVQASIQRSVALEAASRWSIGKADCQSFHILDVAIRFYDWLSTGQIPMQAAPEPGREPGEDDDFENFQPPR